MTLLGLAGLLYVGLGHGIGVTFFVCVNIGVVILAVNDRRKALRHRRNNLTGADDDPTSQ